MKKREKRALSLHRETLRNLTAADLSAIPGGRYTDQIYTEPTNTSSVSDRPTFCAPQSDCIDPNRK